MDGLASAVERLQEDRVILAVLFRPGPPRQPVGDPGGDRHGISAPGLDCFARALVDDLQGPAAAVDGSRHELAAPPRDAGEADVDRVEVGERRRSDAVSAEVLEVEVMDLLQLLASRQVVVGLDVGRDEAE